MVTKNICKYILVIKQTKKIYQILYFSPLSLSFFVIVAFSDWSVGESS